jgi:hypothetical protein
VSKIPAAGAAGIAFSGDFHRRQAGQCQPHPIKRRVAERRDILRGFMVLVARILRNTAVALALFAVASGSTPARADDGFPFGMEMTLDVLAPGPKRRPNLEIGDSGEVILELWCMGGKGQFSVAGNTVIFVAGQMENRICPPERTQADNELIAALSEVATWKRQGDLVTLIGPKTLRFHLNTN